MNETKVNFLTGLAYLIYCIGEEIGWRGWLLRNLSNYSYWIQIAVVWVLWLFWHLAFQPISFEFALLLLVGVFGINLATQKTQSLIVSIAMHAVVNLFSYFFNSMMFIIPIWVLIFWSWNKTQTPQKST